MKTERVLTFHGLGAPPRPLDDGEDDVWLPAEWFAAIVEALGRGDSTRADATRITFDDGNRSDLELALPVLTAHGRTATFFVLAGKLDQPGYLTRADVTTLADAGMTIGSHGLMHAAWSELAPTELTREVAVSKSLLRECTGREIAEAACPFGLYNRRVLGALRDEGYTRVYTSDGGPARADAWLAPRTTIARGRNLDEWLGWLDTEPSLGSTSVRWAKRTVKRWR